MKSLKSIKRKDLMALFLFFSLITFSFNAFANETVKQEQQTTTKNATANNTNNTSTVKRWVLINVPARSLRLYDNDVCIAMYPVAVGKNETRTPAGYYKVVEKIVNPTWTDPSDLSVVIPSGPSNPLGYRWIGIGGNYGIHGTNKPESIGKYVSNGCVRMVEDNVEKVFDMVNVGTEVQIIYNRLVIDKTPDKRIAYYIYPDGYGMQKLTVDFVKKGLAGYGIADFVTNEYIQKSIEASNGQPNYVAAPINIIANGSKLSFKAINYENVIYLPVKNLAEQLHTNIKIDKNIVSTDKGTAQVKYFSGNPYIYLKELNKLFNFNYGLSKDYSQVALLPTIVEPKEIAPTVAETNNSTNTINSTKTTTATTNTDKDKALPLKEGNDSGKNLSKDSEINNNSKSKVEKVETVINK